MEFSSKIGKQISTKHDDNYYWRKLIFQFHMAIETNLVIGFTSLYCLKPSSKPKPIKDNNTDLNRIA